MANKLNTIVSRAEQRDLVDLHFLERAGSRIETAIDLAPAAFQAVEQARDSIKTAGVGAS
jgi:hypothetical protein